jgi:hypothetical protein
MSENAIFWLLGIVFTVLSSIIGYLLWATHKNGDRVSQVERDFANFRAEVPVKYANDADIARVEKAIGEVRQELHTFTTEIRTALTGVAATLNQLVGANANRG